MAIRENDFYPLYEITDQNELPIVQSILESEKIIHHIRNEGLQNMFGIGTIGTGFQSALGGMVVEVAGRDLERCRELFIAEGFLQDPASEQHEDKPEGKPWRGLLFSVLWIFGLGSCIGIGLAIVDYRRNKTGSILALLLGLAGLAGMYIYITSRGGGIHGYY